MDGMCLIPSLIVENKEYINVCLLVKVRGGHQMSSISFHLILLKQDLS